MSWSHISNRGTVQNKTASTTLTLTFTGTVAVGRFLVLWSAWDDHPGAPFPFGGGGTNHDAEYMNRVVDTQGNYWTQVCQIGHQGTATGVRLAMYVCQVKTQLTTSDSVTIHSLPDQFRGSAAGANDIVAKCASVHEFSKATTGWSRRFAWDHDTIVTANGDLPDLVLGSGSLPNEQHLLLYGIAAEGPNTDAYTFDADYTSITATGTTGGADTDNVHVRGGWRIATLTTETVAHSSNTADRDAAQWLMALGEVDIPSGGLTFPQFELLDDFNRADQNPLGAPGWWFDDGVGGGWSVAGGNTVDGGLKIVGNEVVKVHSHDDSYDRVFWNDDIPCRYAEVWATLSGVPSNDSQTQGVPLPPTNYGRRGMGVCIERPFDVGPDFRYEAAWFRSGKFQGWDIHHFHFPGQFFRTQTYIGDMAEGHKIGLQCIDGKWFHSYIDVGSGWEWLHCHDVRNGSGGEIYQWPSPARIGLRMGGKDCAVDDFGGGNDCFRPDTIRRLEMPTP